jgi:uncharacterized membrane protein YqjE
MSDGPNQAPRDPRSVAEMAIDVSERVSYLVREEIELAKAEISEKVSSLVKGSAVGVAAGVFALLGLAMIMHAFAWLLNDLFFGDTVWLGFLVEAVMWFVIAGLAGFIAYKNVQKGAPPVPEMAIEEGKEIRETLQAGSEN